MSDHATVATMTYDDALEVFLRTRASFGGGLSNHGPMASEALVDMGVEEWTGRFVDAYLPRLDRRDVGPVEGHDVDVLLATHLPESVDDAAVAAGHGLLRVAHAVRGIERGRAAGAVPAVRVAELAAAFRYWRVGGRGLPVIAPLAGDRSPADWVAALRALATFDPLPGMLTATLDLAARQPGFGVTVSSLAPDDDATRTLDGLALAAVEGYLRNEDFLSWFALLHGVTVSTMARVLLAHLGPDDQRRLVTSVAGFVAAAIVGFDRPDTDRPDTERPATDAVRLLPIADDLAGRAAATLDDHTIKFTDACLGLAGRTGSGLPLHAAERQIARTTR